MSHVSHWRIIDWILYAFSSFVSRDLVGQVTIGVRQALVDARHRNVEGNRYPLICDQLPFNRYVFNDREIPRRVFRRPDEPGV